jgi:digeranylgeranylglycerophospholipid reductase
VRALDLPREAVLNPLSTVKFVAPSGHSFEYTTSSVEAIVIDRRVFDDSLCRAAARAGVIVQRNTRIESMTTEPDAVSLGTSSGGCIRARAVILACGANYGFQRRLGLGFPAAFLQSAQLEVPAAAPGDVEVHFGSDIAPKGFAWAVPVQRPHGTFARIGVMAERDAGTLFEKMYARVQERWRLSRPEGSTPRRRMLPLAPIACTYADRTLVVGDAAGLVKPTTGGGIYYSIVSGQIAADVLTGCLSRDDLGALALKAYEDEWRARFDREFAAQLALRRLSERLSDPEIDALFSLAQTDGILPIVRRTARFNEHRGLIVALLKYAPARQILLRRLATMVH